MDVSSAGVANSSQYLQRAQASLQGPVTAVKQEEQAAQVMAPVIAQAVQAQQPAQAAAAQAADAARTGIGQVLDITA